MDLTPEARLDLLRARAAREVNWLAPALWALRGPYLTERLPHPAAVSSDGRLYINPSYVQSASDDTVEITTGPATSSTDSVIRPSLP